MVGRTSISGVQRKISLALSPDRATLQVAIEEGRYLLKPQAGTYPALPENEHLTMRLAALAGIEVPALGLVRLTDGSLSYLVARFDRLPTGRKLRQEDFCQLAELPRSHKYQGSAELAVRLVRRFASEPGIEVARLYRRFVFSWIVGNGDLHLKNFSLLTGEDGLHRLSPAYDLVSTRIVLPDDALALPVGGKRDHLIFQTWLGFAAYCQIPERTARKWLRDLTQTLSGATPLIERSFLPDEAKEAYRSLVATRCEVLRAGS
jgi:serine/threonine-protein kinase HipA